MTPTAGRGGAAQDRVAEDDVRETDPEMGHDDAPRGGPRRAGQDRLAERRRRVRVVVELPGVAVRQELAALVDEEEGGVAGDLGGEHRGVVDRHDEGVGASASRRSSPGARTGP